MKPAAYSYPGEREYYSHNWPHKAKPYLHLEPHLRAWMDPEREFLEKRVLDIGAGECTYTRLIADRFRPRLVVACELFPERLRPALRENRNPLLKFVSGNCFRLPFKDSSFDVVFGGCILTQLPNLADALREIHRVLKEGGSYVGWEPNFYHPVILYRYLFKPHSPNQYRLSRRQMRLFFRKAGFSMTGRYYYTRVPFFRNRFVGTCIGIIARKNPPGDKPAPRGILDRFRSINNRWNERFFGQDITTLRHFIARLNEHLPAAGIILDLGCGQIPLQAQVHQVGRGSFRVILGDSSFHSLKHGDTEAAVVLDAEALPFKDNALDLICATYFLEHAARPEAVLPECYRVLKEGGALIFLTPHRNCYVATAARMTPLWFHRWVRFLQTGKGPEHLDVCETLYRANTLSDLRKQSGKFRIHSMDVYMGPPCYTTYLPPPIHFLFILFHLWVLRSPLSRLLFGDSIAGCWVKEGAEALP